MRKLIITAISALGLTVSNVVFSPDTARAEPFIGQVMNVGFNFCPRGWHLADGSLLPIAQWSALFSLYGTTFGGDGRTTFGIPNLLGRTPVGFGAGPGLPTVSWGELTGTEYIALNINNLPQHSHNFTPQAVENDGNNSEPAGRRLAISTNNTMIYSNSSSDHVNMASDTSQATGLGQQFYKRSPFLGSYWCVSLLGIYPSRS